MHQTEMLIELHLLPAYCLDLSFRDFVNVWRKMKLFYLVNLEILMFNFSYFGRTPIILFSGIHFTGMKNTSHYSCFYQFYHVILKIHVM